MNLNTFNCIFYCNFGDVLFLLLRTQVVFCFVECTKEIYWTILSTSMDSRRMQMLSWVTVFNGCKLMRRFMLICLWMTLIQPYFLSFSFSRKCQFYAFFEFYNVIVLIFIFALSHVFHAVLSRLKWQ